MNKCPYAMCNYPEGECDGSCDIERAVEAERQRIIDANAPEIERVNKHIAKLEKQLNEAMWQYGVWRRKAERGDALLRTCLEALNRSDYLGWQLNIPITKAIREHLQETE